MRNNTNFLHEIITNFDINFLILMNLFLTLIQYVNIFVRNVSKEHHEYLLKEKDEKYLNLHRIMNVKFDEEVKNKDVYVTECARLEKENERYEKEIKSLTNEVKNLKQELKSVKFKLSMTKMDLNIANKKLNN